MNKHAYMILAHNDPLVLENLIQVLDDDRYDIYIHIDVKSRNKFNNLIFLTKYAHLEVFSSVNVNWGGFSIVEAELLLLREAMKEHHSYYHLISGEDFPIKDNNYIYNFFEQSGKKEFIFFKSPELDREGYNRIMYYHPLREYCRISKYLRINQCIHTVEKILVFIQILAHFKRKKFFKVFQRGSQWVSITEDFAKAVLALKDEIRHDFSFSFASDEMVFQTVARNIPQYYSRIYEADKYNDCIQNLRLVKWEDGQGPFIFTLKDFEFLIDSPYLFARKISSNVDYDLVVKLREYLDKKNEKN